MKIIHLWNTAGIGGLIARYMDRIKGSESICYMWSKWDPFGHATEKVKRYKRRGAFGKIQTVSLIRRCRGYDIIHNHGIHGLTPLLKFFFPRTPNILHYHGTRIRDKWLKFKKFWKYADKILVSTPDLLKGAPPGVEYVPNLIDWDIINEIKRPPKYNEAYHVIRFAPDMAIDYAEKYNLPLVLHNRERKPLKHRPFLEELSLFSHYIDVKRDYQSTTKDPPLMAHSLTGIEAAALGLTVINWNGERAAIDLDQHRPEAVINQLWRIYNELLGTKV